MGPIEDIYQEGGNNYLKNQKGGDNIIKLKSEITLKLRYLSNFYDFYKTDLLIKVISLIVDKELFTEFYEEVFQTNINDFIPLFFIDISKYNELLKFIQVNKSSYNINKVIERDTYILKLYLQDKEKHIFSPTIIEILNEVGLTDFNANKQVMIDFINIFKELYSGFQIIKIIYNNLNEHYETVDRYYKTLISKNKRVFSYVREITDNNIRNPRFSNIETENNFLNFKPYYNIDGNFSGTNEEKKFILHLIPF